MRSTPLTLLLALLSLAVQSQAQEALLLSPGVRIRVHAPDSSYLQKTGVLVSLSPDLLVFNAGPDTISLDIRSVEALAISRGHRSRGKMVRSRMVLGLLVGTAAGAATAFVWSSTGRCDDCGMAALMGPLVFGSGGAALGAVWGALAPTERWERVQFPGRGNPADVRTPGELR